MYQSFGEGPKNKEMRDISTQNFFEGWDFRGKCDETHRNHYKTYFSGKSVQKSFKFRRHEEILPAPRRKLNPRPHDCELDILPLREGEILVALFIDRGKETGEAITVIYPKGREACTS